jgi:hypothetical protein
VKRLHFILEKWSRGGKLCMAKMAWQITELKRMSAHLEIAKVIRPVTLFRTGLDK